MSQAAVSRLSEATPAGRGRAYLSIGEVLTQLRGDFPEVTVSKIRFLEAEGLVCPERSPSGYRKFAREDVARLRYVLAAQRDHYLPLRVIKDNLDALDRGLEPTVVGNAGPRVPASSPLVGLPYAETQVAGHVELRVSRAELLGSTGLTEAQLGALAQYGLVRPDANGHYDEAALVITQSVAAFAAFGIEARHLRAFKTAADREVGLIEQVVSPLARQRNPEARARGQEQVQQLAALSVTLHAALVRAALRPVPGPPDTAGSVATP